LVRLYSAGPEFDAFLSTKFTACASLIVPRRFRSGSGSDGGGGDGVWHLDGRRMRGVGSGSTTAGSRGSRSNRYLAIRHSLSNHGSVIGRGRRVNSRSGTNRSSKSISSVMAPCSLSSGSVVQAGLCSWLRQFGFSNSFYPARNISLKD